MFFLGNFYETERLLILWFALALCKGLLSLFWERRGIFWDIHFPVLSIAKDIKDLSKPYVLEALFDKKQIAVYKKILRLCPIKKIEFMVSFYELWCGCVIFLAALELLGAYRSKNFEFHLRWEFDQIKEFFFFMWLNFIARMSTPIWTLYFFPNNRIPEVLHVTFLAVAYAFVDSFEMYTKQSNGKYKVKIPIWGLVLAPTSVLLPTLFLQQTLYLIFS